VVDRETGIIWLPFTQNPGEKPESLVVEGKASRTIWLTWSEDDGATWAEPVEITDSTKRDNWTWYATGPCHGIQLQSGRLVIPCDHVVGTTSDYLDSGWHALPGFYAHNGHSHVIYSDDHGQSWAIGGIAQSGTNESCVVETVPDGDLYLNCRNYHGDKRRAYAWSHDQGDSFTDFGWDEDLPEPICQASMVRYSSRSDGDRNRVLFANPASHARERLTVRISYDECQSWGSGKVLHQGLSAYSDLCVTEEKIICCLYERGTEGLYETLTLARFDLAWLTDGRDQPAA
jgi:sialidase-1